MTFPLCILNISQAGTEKKRRELRAENREKAIALLREGRSREAKEYFQRCVDITPDMALQVIKAARDRNVDCIVAPYEADAELAFLSMAGLADVVVTEDSDLTSCSTPETASSTREKTWARSSGCRPTTSRLRSSVICASQRAVTTSQTFLASGSARPRTAGRRSATPT